MWHGSAMSQSHSYDSSLSLVRWADLRPIPAGDVCMLQNPPPQLAPFLVVSAGVWRNQMLWKMNYPMIPPAGLQHQQWGTSVDQCREAQIVPFLWAKKHFTLTDVTLTSFASSEFTCVVLLLCTKHWVCSQHCTGLRDVARALTL